MKFPSIKVNVDMEDLNIAISKVRYLHDIVSESNSDIAINVLTEIAQDKTIGAEHRIDACKLILGSSRPMFLNKL